MAAPPPQPALPPPLVISAAPLGAAAEGARQYTHLDGLRIEALSLEKAEEKAQAEAKAAAAAQQQAAATT